MTVTAHPASDVRTDRWLARLAGLVAAGVALGVGELASAMAVPKQSLVGSIGGEVIDQAPGSLVRTGIDTLGTADKPVLVATIVVVSLLLGALAGGASLRRRWIGPVAFAAAGLVGLLAALRDPLSDDAVAWVATVLAVVAGSVALLLLLRLLPGPRAAVAAPIAQPIPQPGKATGTRRSFLTWTGVAGAAGVVAALGGKAWRGGSVAEEARRTVTLPEPTSSNLAVPATVGRAADGGFEIEGLAPLITPNDDFYRIDTALVVPQADLGSWRLEIDGEVERPLTFTFDDLLAMPQVAVPVTIACVSNAVGGDLVGTAVWQGIPLSTLLDEAGVKPGGDQIVGRSLDDFTVGFPTAAAYDGRTALLALGMNGEPLPVLHGFPARLIVEGLYGYVSATKWLSRIELRGWDDYDAYWVPLGWAKEGPIKTQSRIDVPLSTKKMKAGETYPIAGVAWAPGRGIERVEVKVDDGPWVEAELSPTISDATWRQWLFRWTAVEGKHQVSVRATDGTGEVQTDKVARPDPDGASGYHSKVYKVEASSD